MVERAVRKLIDVLEKNNLISKEQYEEYLYTLLGDVEMVISTGSILLISIIVARLVLTIFFLMFFFSLRKRTGGYHFNSYAKCYIGTLSVYGIVYVLSNQLKEQMMILIGVTLLAYLVILIIGTVNHPNMDMDEEELQDSKSLARMVVTMEVCIVLFLIWIEANKMIITYSCMAIVLCAFLLCVAKYKGQEVKQNAD